jgi:hypothetical protein
VLLVPGGGNATLIPVTHCSSRHAACGIALRLHLPVVWSPVPCCLMRQCACTNLLPPPPPAGESWFALAFLSQHVYLETLRDMYEAYAMFSFFKLLRAYLSDTEEVGSV